MMKHHRTLKSRGKQPRWFPTFCNLLRDSIAAWAAASSLNLQQIDGGWRVVISYNGGAVAFDYEVPDGFEDKPLSKEKAVSAAWAMTGIARTYRPLAEFAKFMRHEILDDGIAAKYEEWSRISRECIALFGDGFGNDKALKEQAKHVVSASD
jgi:hypothetical protein